MTRSALDYVQWANAEDMVTVHYIAAWLALLRCVFCTKMWTLKLDQVFDESVAFDLLVHAREARSTGCR